MNGLFTRIISLWILLILTQMKLFGQTSPPTMGNPMAAINQQLRNVFSPLSRPTPVMDYLYDMTGHVTDEKYWTHFSVDTSSTDNWYRLFWEQFYMAYDTSSLVKDIDLYDAVLFEYRGDTVPIGIMDISYYKLKEDALTTGTYFIFDTINTTLSELITTDPPGGSNSPYEIDNIFTAAPLFNYTRKKYMTWVVDPAYIFYDATNSVYYDPAGQYKLMIDFGDGNGWQEFDPTMKVFVNVDYTNTIFGGDLIIKVEILVDDVPIKHSRSSMNLGRVRSDDPQFDAEIFYGDLPVYVYRACGSDPSNRKIVIYLEGIDMLDFIPRLNRDADDIYDQMISRPSLNQLRNFGYDFYIVDWANSRRDMRENALEVVGLINALKAEVENDHEFIIIGESMGGVIARYALCYMESQNYLNPALFPNANRRERMHNCRLMVTLDAPHQGANIPLSVQFMYDELFKIGRGVFGFPMLGRAITYYFDLFLESTAAKQLLLYHKNTKSGLGLYKNYSAHSERTSFLSDLNSLGNYPQFCKKLAVSNGAFNGEKQTLSYDFNERTANDNLLDFGLSLYARILGISVPIIGADMEMRTNPDGDGLSFQFNGGTYEIILRFYWFGVKFITGYNSEFNRSEFVNTNPYCVNAGGFFETGLDNLNNFIGQSTSSEFNLSDNYWILNLFSISGGSDGSGCWNGGLHLGINGIASANASLSLCSDGFSFCFIPVQSALDYGVLGSVSLDTDFEDVLNADRTLMNTMTPFDVIVFISEDDVEDPLDFDVNSLNQAHLYIKYEDEHADLQTSFGYRDCTNDIYGHWLSREIGDEILHLDNYDLSRDGIYEPIYELYVNQFANPWYTYVGGNTGSRPGFFSKKNDFRIRDNVNANFLYDIPSHNPPHNVNFLFTPFALQGTTPFDGTWLEDNSSGISCGSCINYGKKEPDSNKKAYFKSIQSFATVFPNPTSNRQLSISYSFKDNLPVRITIYDMLGRPVLSKNNIRSKAGELNGTVLKLGDSVSTGMYMVVIENGSERFVEKIIVH